MKNATCSSSCDARRLRLGEQDRDAHLELRRLERDGEAPAEARDQALLHPRDLLRVGVAGDDDLLVRLDQRVEEVEELFLRAVLAVEELDVVDQQQVERAVVALEVVERLVLVGAHHVGHVGLGVDVADPGAGFAREDVVADRLDQVGLAEADAAVDEQRVVGGRMVGDLHAGGAGELVGLAGDEGRERERRVEARLVVPAQRHRRRGHVDGASAGGAGAALAGGASRRAPSASASGARAAASATASVTGPARPSASVASSQMRPAKRSLTHCSTKRLGATTR